MQIPKNLPYLGAALGLSILAMAGAYVTNARSGLDQFKASASSKSATVNPGPTKDPKNLWIVEIGTSTSDVAQRPLLDQRLTNIATAAGMRRATVEVYLLNQASDVTGIPALSIDFRGGCTTDNDQCSPDPAIAQRFISAATSAVDDARPSGATDIAGALATISRRRHESGSTVAVSGILITDGVSTTASCDMGVMPLRRPYTAAVARCLQPYEVNLHEIPVYLSGLGQSSPTALVAGADSDVLRAAPGFVADLINETGGEPHLVNLETSATALLRR